VEAVGSREAHEDLPPPLPLPKGFMPKRVVLEELVVQESGVVGLGESDSGTGVTLALFLMSRGRRL
jgi:hypothetical protein